jgi:hypothetical protein
VGQAIRLPSRLTSILNWNLLCAVDHQVIDRHSASFDLQAQALDGGEQRGSNRETGPRNRSA